MTGEERAAALREFKHSAFRLEQQARYGDTGAEMLAWLEGDRRPPTTYPGLPAWYDNVRSHTAAGHPIVRVRVVEKPPTGYQRWSRWVSQWNVEAGETIHYMTRTELDAVDKSLGNTIGSNDWWLLDDEMVIIYEHNRDGSISRTYRPEREPETAMIARNIRTALLAAVEVNA